MIHTDEALKKAEETFIEGFSRIGAIWNINAIESKIVAYLASHSRPVSLNGLVDTLKASKGNISIAIRKLEEQQLVKKVWVKGDRKDYYQISVDIWQIFLKKMRDNFKFETIKALETIDDTIKTIQGSFVKLNNEDSDTARNFMQELQKMKTYYTLTDEISKGLENEVKIELNKMRMLWSTVKSQLKTIKK
jgi:DNA-binding transcriptional regulator GbsR (MarR family)